MNDLTQRPPVRHPVPDWYILKVRAVQRGDNSQPPVGLKGLQNLMVVTSIWSRKHSLHARNAVLLPQSAPFGGSGSLYNGTAKVTKPLKIGITPYRNARTEEGEPSRRGSKHLKHRNRSGKSRVTEKK